MIKDAVTIIIDQETYRKLSKIAERKQKHAVDEISKALENHITKEDEKFKEIHEGKKYLTEDK